MRCEYDRGTVILRDLPPGAAEKLPHVTWDDRIAAHRAVASDWPRLPQHAALAGQPGIPAASDAVAPRMAVPELRAYQRAALDTWLSCGRRGVVVLPTGAGKTRIALVAMAELAVPALVLVPTRVLLVQWAEALQASCAARVGRLGDSHHDVRPLTVATYASATRHAPRLGDRFGLLVVDEAHHAGGTLRPEALEMSLAPFRLGLTALAPAASVRTRLAAILGPIVFEMRVRDLTGSALAPARLVGIGLDMTAEERARWLGEMSLWRAEMARHALELAGRPRHDAARVLALTSSGRQALAARTRARALQSFTTARALVLRLILERHRDDRTIVFTSDNATAQAISSAHLVPAVTCEMRARERREVLAAFAAGDLRTLVSARVLDEGLDVPEASVAVIVGASGSDRQHVQRVGRVLRPAPGKTAVVYDLFHVETGESRSAAARRAALAG